VINDWKEDCECDDGSKNCLLRNADSVVRVNNYDEVRCVECRIVKENTIQPVACFNVNNGSISINQ